MIYEIITKQEVLPFSCFFASVEYLWEIFMSEKYSLYNTSNEILPVQYQQ